MKKVEFKKWLEDKYEDSNLTVSNRFSNCKHVEEYYGDLDTHYERDKCSLIIEELNYTTDDERNNREAKHLIPIDGNVRNGSATLKQAIRLYVQFREDFEVVKEHIEKIVVKNSTKAEVLKREINNCLDSFKYDKKKHSDIGVLQLELVEYMSVKLPNYSWYEEYRSSEAYKDRIDIMGISNNSDYKIIIELDAHRADQVSKKFVSRTALHIEDNFIYVALCYQGTENMKVTEVKKYFNFCDNIINALSKDNDKEKVFIGKIL